jgi:hypothetical protein
MEPTLVCLSNARFEEPWQRTQQLMARLAGRMRVVFVEAPWLGGFGHLAEPAWEERSGRPNLRVLRPLVPIDAIRPGRTSEDIIAALFERLLAEVGPRPIIWVASPAAARLTAIASPHARLIVYD